MGEEYTGIKFTCKSSGKITASPSQINQYLKIDSSLKQFLSPKQNEGNMSMRTQNGFLIKGAGEKITELKKESLSHIIDIDEKSFTLTAEGKIPSSESFLHHITYKSQPNINLILHLHNDSLLNSIPKEKFPRIPPLPYGSMELAKAAAKPKENIIVLENHGFILKAGKEEELEGLLKQLFPGVLPDRMQ